MMNKIQISSLSILIGYLFCIAAFSIDNIRHGMAPLSEYQVINAYKDTVKIKTAELQVATQAILDLNEEIDSLKSIINNTHVVIATVYYPTGDEMRSGKFIPCNYHQSDSIKYIAISQDLWTKNGGPYSFGDFIQIRGTPYDGIYVVEDTMNKRHKNRVDILMSGKINEQWHNVKIYKV